MKILKKKQPKTDVLIPRGHVSLIARFWMVGSHLFFQLPLFQMKRKAKTPEVGGNRKAVGCGCETEDEENEAALDQIVLFHT